MEQLARQPCIPRGEEGAGVECVLDLSRVPSLHGRSYQRLMVAQPVKLGGTGLRSLEETRYPAFLGGLEQSLPYMVAGEHCEAPLVPGLRAAVGSMAGPERWTDMLAAGSHTARELQDIWGSLAHPSPRDILRVTRHDRLHVHRIL